MINRLYVVALFAVVSSLLSASPAWAANPCEQYFHVNETPVTKQTVPGSLWSAVSVENLARTSKYLDQMYMQRMPADAARVLELLAFEEAHLEVSTHSSGLRFVTVHGSDGKQIFKDSYFRGLTAAELKGSEKLSDMRTPPAFLNENLALGGGFVLRYFQTDRESGVMTTFSQASKTYAVEGGLATLTYYITVKGASEISALKINYEETLGQGPSKTTTVEVEFAGGELAKTEIKVEHGLGGRRSREIDAIGLDFDGNGQFVAVNVFSTTKIENPEWSHPDIVRAIHKGKNMVSGYAATSTTANLLMQTVVGNGGFNVISKQVVDKLLAAALRGEKVDLSSLLDYEKK